MWCECCAVHAKHAEQHTQTNPQTTQKHTQRAEKKKKKKKKQGQIERNARDTMQQHVDMGKDKQGVHSHTEMRHHANNVKNGDGIMPEYKKMGGNAGIQFGCTKGTQSNKDDKQK